MAEVNWTISSIVGTIILLSISITALYNSDYKYIIASLPDKDVFLLEYNQDNKIEVMTKSSVCPYVLFRITKDKMSAKCGWRRVVDTNWYLEYYKTYGDDEWVRLNRKPTKVTLDISEVDQGFLITRVTPYYATKSRSGTAGKLIETFRITPDSIKSSLEFQTSYTNRLWKVIWKTTPNVDVVEDSAELLRLEKNLNIIFSDTLFQKREDNLAHYFPQKGSFVIDPLIQFGNLSSTLTAGSFKYGYCDSNCNNVGNVTFKSDSSSFQANYFSGWEESPDLRQPDNLTFECIDRIGNGYCEISIRNGTEIIPVNNADTIERCIINQSLTCANSRNILGSGSSYSPGMLNNYDGLLINDSDLVYLPINTSDPVGVDRATGSNYTINLSAGYIEMMVQFR